VRAAYDGYYEKRDFFSVIWQVNLPREGQEAKPIGAHRVRLQVESPTHEVDCFLNDLKLEVIQAILNSDIRQAVLNAGFDYDQQYLKMSEKDIRQNQTTTVFRVMLTDEQSALTPEEKMEMVHAVLASRVDAIVEQFRGRLEERF